jgi:ubiquitin carboxyl-terminal hydrolase L3
MLKEYKKHFLPLESNPDVFNELIRLLGAKDEIAFEDVLTLDEPEFLPRPALAVVLVLPSTPADDEKKVAMEADRPDYNGEDGEPVLWFEQRIHNACGLYAILHALCNVEPHRFLGTWRGALFFHGSSVGLRMRS